MRPDPDGTPDDSKTDWLWTILDRVIKCLVGWLIGWRRAIQALWHGMSNILPRCRHRVGTMYSFLNMNICRCLNAKTLCKIKKASYSLIKTTVIVSYLLRLRWSRRQNSSLSPLMLHDVFALRHSHISMFRNDYTVSTRWRHQGGIVDPHAPILVWPSASRSAIQSDTLSPGPKHSNQSIRCHQTLHRDRVSRL
jgi:hypothetical protein